MNPTIWGENETVSERVISLRLLKKKPGTSEGAGSITNL